ncbi:hypothetical protein AB663_000804 [Microbacterium sp. XT11]|nr:hypothetical protein AB663_000804 [Microbacterium sp. XT11]
MDSTTHPEYSRRIDATAPTCVCLQRGRWTVHAHAAAHRVRTTVLWGGLGVLAWALLTLVTGGGTAHADESAPDPVGGLTGLVSDAVDATTTTVSSVVAPAIEAVVAPAVEAVVVPTVEAVVAPTVEAVVAPAVEAVVAPVQEAAPVVQAATSAVATIAPVPAAAVVSQIRRPLTDAVSQVPVIGGVLDDLGVTEALDDVTGAVDDSAGTIGSVIDSTVPPVVGALTPEAPRPPDSSVGEETPASPQPASPHTSPHASAPSAGSSSADVSTADPGSSAAHLADPTSAAPRKEIPRRRAHRGFRVA